MSAYFLAIAFQASHTLILGSLHRTPPYFPTNCPLYDTWSFSIRKFMQSGFHAASFDIYDKVRRYCISHCLQQELFYNTTLDTSYNFLQYFLTNGIIMFNNMDIIQQAIPNGSRRSFNLCRLLLKKIVQFFIILK